MKKALINYIQNEKFDELYTPEYAIIPLLKYIPKNITVWECCDFGKSKITKLLKENFLVYNQKENFDMIITNPPYSLKDEFLNKCYEWNKPFCLLLPITSLEGIKRGRCLELKELKFWFLTKGLNLLTIKRAIGSTHHGFVGMCCLKN